MKSGRVVVKWDGCVSPGFRKGLLLSADAAAPPPFTASPAISYLVVWTRTMYYPERMSGTRLRKGPSERLMRESGATQVDLTLRRQCQLRTRLSFQARGDFLNIYNSPISQAPSTIPVLPYPGNRADAGSVAGKRRPRMAASIRCIKSADRARRKCL